jgi:hypothetical protein
MTEPLLDRLLVDAEARAVRREPREALLLLRWAATIASRAMMPRVLLAFHRVRALHAMSDHSASVPPARSHVESDRLGFPVPRFAIRPPELDRTAFVPAPRFTSGMRIDADGEAGVHPHPRAPGGGRLVVLLSLVVVATTGAVLLGVRPWGGGGATTEAAAAALRLGNPREAVSILDRFPEPDTRALLVRGQALLALADTPAAALSLQKAVGHPGATAEDVISGARMLARLPCCAAMAADAYIVAFERGIPSERVPEIAQQLERAGRSDQARRIRDLGGGRR